MASTEWNGFVNILYTFQWLNVMHSRVFLIGSVRNMLIFPMCCVSYSVSFDSNIIFYSWVPRLRKYFFLKWFCRIKLRTHLNWICAIDWKDLSLYNVQPTLWNPTGNNQIITTSVQSNVRIDCKHLQMFLPATYMDQIMHQPTNRMSRAKEMAENTTLTHKRTRNIFICDWRVQIKNDDFHCFM